MMRGRRFVKTDDQTGRSELEYLALESVRGFSG